MKNAQNKFRKLTNDEVNRSIKAGSIVNHIWVYSKYDTHQRTHNNSIYLTRTIGEPIACIVVKYGSCMCDSDIIKFFGNGSFTDGGVSPDDKENILLRYPCYYYKGA